MNKNLTVFLILSLITVFVWIRSLFNFFAQDDFVLLNHFSQNSLLVDVRNAFGAPEVTHWRPLHNLFFLIGGNIFGKFYPGYHIIILLIHTICAFLVFKIFSKLFNSTAGFFASIVYAAHPLHFTSLFWISGGAVNIGFLFFALSLYLFILKRQLGAFLFYFLSLLATEAMVVGILIFVATSVFLKRIKNDFSFLSGLFVLTVLFSGAKLLFFTSPDTFKVYGLEVSQRTIFALRFYLLRIFGFVEGQGKSLFSFALVAWLFTICFTYIRRFWTKGDLREFIFLGFMAFAGLFPFVMIPGHLSAHYMVVSAFGLSGLIGLAVYRLEHFYLILLAVVFLLISFSGQMLAEKNSWVLERGEIARKIIGEIGEENKPRGSTLIFADTSFSNSEEQYVALGTGKAIDFFYREKDYNLCFTFLESCESARED